MSDRRLDDTDARLLHALQIEPRASWQDLAPVVGVDPGTLARRWVRLHGEGIAWSTGYGPTGQMALLELECANGEVEAVAAELRRHPEALVVDFSSGSRDILVLTGTDDLAAMSAYSVNRLGAISGIRAVHTHLINELLIEAGSWRLRALSPAEAARIPPPRPPRPRAAKQVPDDLAAALRAQLRLDGRASLGALAAATGFSAQRVGDAIATMRATGELKFRTDIARTYSEWPVYAWYFVEAPARVVESAKKQIPAIPEVRLAGTAASKYNLIIAVWLRRLADINRLEIALTSAFEGSRIADRAVVLRIDKHLGRVIGPDGRATGISDA